MIFDHLRGNLHCTMSSAASNRNVILAIVVAALGYFVDIYDLLLFAIIRIQSLKDLGMDGEALLLEGESILSWQMFGLMIGGIIWGVMGDKRGRLKVLFASIIIYSLANIANGFVETMTQYKVIRFIAGLGLAGELGAGITLVAELTSKERRGLATSLVAGVGLLGAVFAFIIKENYHWRTCYFIGGGMGLMLLILRVSVSESGIYAKVLKDNITKGSLKLFVTSKERFLRYSYSVLIGLPTWFVIGVLVAFSNDFAKALNITGEIDPGKAIMYAYAAISLGDIAVGVLSQYLRSRKKALYIFYGITAFFMFIFFTQLQGGTPQQLYWVCAGLGFGTGFWAIFVTIGAEQFGTNIRATAATTIPNMVRGLLSLLIIPMFKFFRGVTGDLLMGGWITAIVLFAITLYAAYHIQETFNKDLNYTES